MRLTVDTKGADANDLRRQAQEFTRAVRRAGDEVADVGSETILRTVRAKRGSLRFGRSSLGVRDQTRSSGNGFTVTLTGTPAGPWAIVNDGARAHRIKPRGRALSFEGKAFARVDHPGVRGSHVWDAAEQALTREVGDTIEETIDRAVD